MYSFLKYFQNAWKNAEWLVIFYFTLQPFLLIGVTLVFVRILGKRNIAIFVKNVCWYDSIL